MERKIDLLSIITSYVNKNNSPFIDPDTFVAFLEGYAKKAVKENPEWEKWTRDTDVKFWTELAALAEEGKCELLTDTPSGRVYLPHFYQNLLEDYYRSTDDNADLPFPSEESLKIEIPERQFLSLGVGSELCVYLEEPQEAHPPIVRINFPGEIPPVLILGSLIPRRLIEACLMKIRYYLRENGNKEYALNKLTMQLPGKGSMLRDMLNKITIRPLECYSGIVEGGEFSYLFWAHFSILVKNDMKKKKDPLGSDIAALQSVHLIETMNGYYKALAAKLKEKELAFKMLEQSFAKPPYLYTLEQIIKFASPKGPPLLGQYTREELSERLEKLTNESEENKLPELLVITGPANEQFFILKSKLLLCGNKFIADAREKVKNEIAKNWVKILKDYQRDPAMENDKDFEKALVRYTGKLCPMLNAILEDRKFQLVYEELDQNQEIPPSSRIFVQGELIPYSSLLLIRRKDLLTDARLILPFWYSVPLIVALVSFFRKFGKKKAVKAPGTPEEEDIFSEAAPVKDENQEIAKAAREIEIAIVPKEHTIDSYLEELKFRWGRLVDKKARENLVEDVNALVRDNLRKTFRIQKHFKITLENVVELAASIVERTPSLNNMSGKESLRTYIELYIVKLLETLKMSPKK